MKNRIFFFKLFPIYFLLGMLLLSCGGGGDGSSSQVPPAPENVTIVADKASPGLLGAVGTVKFTAEANGNDAGGNYEYQFLIREGSQGDWVVTQDYGNGNTWNWTPTAAGSFTIAAWAKNVESPVGEANTWMTFDIVDTPVVPGPLEFVDLTADKASPGILGTVGTVKFTAEANGNDAGGNYEYQFLIREGSQGDWVVTQDYGNGNTWNWTPTAAGSFTIAVWAKNIGSTQNEAFASISFDIVTNDVEFVVLTADKKSPVKLGKAGTITFTAEANGDDSGGEYEYKFWIRNFWNPSWTMVQDYGNENTWGWEPTAKGSYTIRVWTKGAGAPVEYQASETMNFTIN